MKVFLIGLILLVFSTGILALFFLPIKQSGPAFITVDNLASITNPPENSESSYRRPLLIPAKWKQQSEDFKRNKTVEKKGKTVLHFLGILTEEHYYSYKKTEIQGKVLQDSIPLKETHEYFIGPKFWTIRNEDGRAFSKESDAHVTGNTNSIKKRYHLKTNVPFLRKYEKRPGDNSDTLFATDTKIDYKYSRPDKIVLIPITKNAYDIYRILFFIFSLAIMFVILIIVFKNFIPFLIDIVRGRVFSAKNYRRLRDIGIFLLIFPLLILVTSWLIGYCYKNIFTDDVYFDTDGLAPMGACFAVGIFFMILYYIFKRGYGLQQENELTV